MSMNSYPAFGYVYPVKFFSKLFSKKEWEKIETLMVDCDREPMESLVNKVLKKNGYPECGIVILSDEDWSDDLEEGVWYLCFCTSGLYKMELNDKGKKVQDLAGKPTVSQWTIWG